MLSPFLLTLYINDLSLLLMKLPIGCCSDTIVSHLMYADDTVRLAPLAKGLQRLLDVSYSYGCGNDIPFNRVKSQMFSDTKKTGFEVFKLGDAVLNTTKSYKYLGHIICDDLLDENDIKSKERSLYGRSNILLRKFYFCSKKVKNKLNCSHLIVVMCIYVPYGLIMEKPLCSTLLFPIRMHLGFCTASL